VSELNRMIAALSDKLDSQAKTIESLAAKPVVRKTHPIVGRNKPLVQYNIQAVIPGRAWIVATNGTTLTVREGSKVPGYGLVKLIDPNQGRVITSSGRVIRFSQEDS
jgi:intracellular multiplication protein IcmG